MANVHRREVLRGFVAGAVGAPLAGAPSAAAERTEPPGDGPLSVKEVGSLLGQHNVPGASLAIIQNGEIVATYGYGVAQPNRPVTPRTRFQAASISKTFNALGARGAQAGRSERVPPRRSGQSTTPVVETSRQCAHRGDACYHPYALEPYRRHQHARVRGLSAWCAVAEPDRDPEWQPAGQFVAHPGRVAPGAGLPLFRRRHHGAAADGDRCHARIRSWQPPVSGPLHTISR
jgi:hypothetical protein